jgi:hypothetical protein
MKTILNWKKGLFKSIYEIFSDSILVGYMNERSWTQSSHGELYGEKYYFRIKGFFKQEIEVFNNDNSNPIARITYNSWMTKSKIEYSGKTYFWKFDNFWGTSWSLYNAEGLQIKYNCSSSRGRIEYDLKDNLLVLTGLYINNYYRQTTLVTMIAVFLPVWMSVFH